MIPFASSTMREAVILDEAKPQHAFVKGSRLLRVTSWHKSNDIG